MGENFLLKRALIVVDQSDQIEVLDKDRDDNLHGDKNMLIEEKLTEIANTLGISMEGSIRELRRFVHEMLAEEKDKCTAANHSRKKIKSTKGIGKIGFLSEL